VTRGSYDVGTAVVVNGTDDPISVDCDGNFISLTGPQGTILQVTATEGGSCAPRPGQPNVVVCTVTRPGVRISVEGVQRLQPPAAPAAAPAPPPAVTPAILQRAATPTPAPPQVLPRTGTGLSAVSVPGGLTGTGLLVAVVAVLAGAAWVRQRRTSAHGR
jgi:hypothetical protein